MESILCAYCENLQVLDRPRRGTASRCPLCRSETLRTGSGTVYRVPAGGPVAPSAPAGWPIVLVAGLAVVGAIGAWAGLKPGESRTSPVVAEMAPAVEVADAARASWKPGTAQTFVGTAKPSVHPPRAEGKPEKTPAEPVTPTTPVLVAAPVLPPAVLDGPSPFAAVPGIPFRSASASPPISTPSLSRREPSPSVKPSELRPSSDDTLLIVQAGLAPEMALYSDKAAPNLEELSRNIVKKNAEKADSFVAGLAEQPEFARLPFAMGDACRISADAAKSLATHSIALNAAISQMNRARPNTPASLSRPADESNLVQSFWDDYLDVQDFGRPTKGKPTVRQRVTPESLPALEQVLVGQGSMMRQSLVHEVVEAEPAAFSEVLVRRALFDFDPAVRKAAIAALGKRPTAKTTDLLVAGFRYPWSPVAKHAAEALVAMKKVDVVARLEGMRHERDPYLADEKPAGGEASGPKPPPMIREVVRVNHLRNCFLCHPALDKKEGLALLRQARTNSASIPVGVVPVPGKPIPVRYYDSNRADIFVRADVTYLRQDFSALLEVASPGAWPAYQRFDFLVRVRPQMEIEQERAPLTTLERSANGPMLLAAIEQLRAVEAESDLRGGASPTAPAGAHGPAASPK